MTTTNSNSLPLASYLAEGRHGTFTGLLTTKVGTVRGGKVYGNDRVQTVFITGFSYENLVRRSLTALPKVDAMKMVAKVAKKGHTITVADVEAARAELQTSFEETLAGTNESTTENVYEPLTLNGVTVIGSRVYKCAAEMGIRCHCRDCTGDPRAPLTGTVYLQGLKIWSRIEEAAPNGPIPEPKSAPKTLAKNALRSVLPVSRYVSYRLEPSTDYILRVGGTAKDITDNPADATEIAHNAAEALTEVV